MVEVDGADGMYRSDPQTSWGLSGWPTVSGQLVSAWRNESMQNFDIVLQYTWRKLGWGLDLMYCLV